MTPEESSENFTERECQVILAVYRGLSNKEVAQQCRIAEGGVQTIMSHVFDNGWYIDSIGVALVRQGRIKRRTVASFTKTTDGRFTFSL